MFLLHGFAIKIHCIDDYSFPKGKEVLISEKNMPKFKVFIRN